MNPELLIERLFPLLVSGDRVAARACVAEAVTAGVTAEELAHEVYWPTLEMISSLHRKDQLTNLAHHYAIRILRSLIAQAQAGYERRLQSAPRSRSVLMFCGTGELDELAAQLAADLAEAQGFDVRFGGGGIANDEILAEVGERRPDVLLMFASGATDAPNIRMLIDTIREINACGGMQIAVGGGVFNRAEGLAEEIGADVWGKTPRSLIGSLMGEPARRANCAQRTVGRRRIGVRKAA